MQMNLTLNAPAFMTVGIMAIGQFAEMLKLSLERTSKSIRVLVQNVVLKPLAGQFSSLCLSGSTPVSDPVLPPGGNMSD